MKPPSIDRFSQIFLASLALSVVYSALTIDRSRKVLALNPGTANLGDGFLFATIAFGFAISLLLWFLVVRRRSGIARWVLVVLTVAGLIWAPGTMRAAMAIGTGYFALAASSLFLQLVAVGFLFTREARDWFAGRAAADTVEPSAPLGEEPAQ
jgi:hypothetical protein